MNYHSELLKERCLSTKKVYNLVINLEGETSYEIKSKGSSTLGFWHSSIEVAMFYKISLTNTLG